MRKALFALVVALPLLLGFPAAATADAEAPLVTVEGEGDCELVTLTFENPTEWDYSGDVRVDNEPGEADQWSITLKAEGPPPLTNFGHRYQDVPIPAGETVTHEVSFDEGSGEHTVAFRIARGPEQHNYSIAWDEIVVDCAPEPKLVTPTEPTVTDETCDESGTITIPEVTGVEWSLDNEASEPGKHEAEPGDYSVQTSALDGYVFDADEDPVFDLTVAAAEDCATSSPTPEPTPEPPEELPETGPDATWLVVLGSALILFGVGAMVLRAYRK